MHLEYTMPEDKAIKIAFVISLAVHCLFLGIPGFNLSKLQPKDPEEISVQIKIEKPPLLPKIDVMGEEKKLKQVIKKEEEPPKPEFESEPEPQSEERKIIEELQPKEQIEEEIVKQPQPEPPQEFVKVINPQEEAMLRYQDMVKQKIESCRRYPDWAKRQGIEGTVHLRFTILSNGQAKDIEIIHPSGFNILDKEALSTIKRAQPFPPIPPQLKTSFLTMEVSIVFILQY